MSIYARKNRMTDRSTFWALAGDSYYGGGWSTPTSLSCNYKTGGTLARDTEGNEFTPRSTYRFYGDPSIKIGDKIIQGDSVSVTPDDNSETVRQVITKTPMRGLAAYDVLTG